MIDTTLIISYLSTFYYNEMVTQSDIITVLQRRQGTFYSLDGEFMTKNNQKEAEKRRFIRFPALIDLYLQSINGSVAQAEVSGAKMKKDRRADRRRATQADAWRKVVGFDFCCGVSRGQTSRSQLLAKRNFCELVSQKLFAKCGVLRNGQPEGDNNGHSRSQSWPAALRASADATPERERVNHHKAPPKSLRRARQYFGLQIRLQSRYGTGFKSRSCRFAMLGKCNPRKVKRAGHQTISIMDKSACHAPLWSSYIPFCVFRRRSFGQSPP